MVVAPLAKSGSLFTNASVGTRIMIAGSHSKGLEDYSNGESVFQPFWLSANELLFITDLSGWWNVWWARIGDDGHVIGKRNLFPVESDVGRPQWLFGVDRYFVDQTDRRVFIMVSSEVKLFFKISLPCPLKLSANMLINLIFLNERFRSILLI